MSYIKLIPSYKDYIWGGTKLKSWGKKSSLDKIAESWELSFHPDGPSYLKNKDGELVMLKDHITKEQLGKNIDKYPYFPVLIKLIDAKENLSIQVHPNDEYALKNENSYGKIEMWYILDAEKDAGLYVGFKENQTKESINKMLKEGTINDSLNFFNVKKGDFFIIEPGIVHAIGKGVTLIEIQQNSNITYRLYDYDRVDKNGNKRELHIKKALDVISLEKYIKNETRNNILTENKYFSSYIGNSSIKELKATSNSFITFTIIEGNGYVGNEEIKLGDTFFLPASEKVELKGDFKFIYTTI